MRIPPNHCPVVAPVITVPLAHVAAAAQRGGAHDPPTASAAADAAADAADAARVLVSSTASADAADAADDAALVRDLIFASSQSMFSDFIDEAKDLERLSVLMIETAASIADSDLASAMRAFGYAIGRIGRKAGHGGDDLGAEAG